MEIEWSKLDQETRDIIRSYTPRHKWRYRWTDPEEADLIAICRKRKLSWRKIARLLNEKHGRGRTARSCAGKYLYLRRKKRYEQSKMSRLQRDRKG